eukprot:scaffold16615_cov23-Cyclotella_meneghiniana.AAC.1
MLAGSTFFRGYLLCHNANEWGRLANAFGINQNIKMVHIKTGGGLQGDRIESYQCVKNAQFKTNLRLVEFLNELRVSITSNQCQNISIYLEALMTTEHPNLFITQLSDTQEGPLNATVFQRLLDVCSDVYSLRVYCSSPSHCLAVASFLRDTNTVKFTVDISDTLSLEDEATIIHGLRGNTSLRHFHLDKRGFSYRGISQYDPHGYLAKALCESSSIENILNSNHTLIGVYPGFESSESELSDSESVIQFERVHVKVANCLELNENTDKDKVKREKIARYDFVGDFDVSPNASLPVSVVPSVLLGMIQSDKLDRQFAIFRLLKSIPDLYNVGSRAKIVS